MNSISGLSTDQTGQSAMLSLRYIQNSEHLEPKSWRDRGSIPYRANAITPLTLAIGISFGALWGHSKTTSRSLRTKSTYTKIRLE